MSLRILFALPGLHRVERGAEIALMSVASELAKGGDKVTLIGSGEPREGTPYQFLHAGALPRGRFERFPKLPALRNETAYEELTFLPGFLRQYKPSDYDITVACSYPFVQWALRRPTGGERPAHIFVTQNGDWPVHSNKSEYRFFSCDGVICINPDYYETARSLWRAALIPNGVAVDRFTPGPGDRAKFGLPEGKRLVLMVSALIASKRVDEGIRAIAQLPDVHLVCAGDGPERAAIDRLAAELLPGRFTRLTAAPADMPLLYRSCDAFLHLSLDESFGNVFVEALACGLPVVAEDWERTRWIVGDDQFLCNTRDRTALAAQIERSLATGEAQAEIGRERAQQFSWANIATQYRDFFEQVIAARRSSAD